VSDQRCLTCSATTHASGLTCICGGVGTRDAETDGLRRYAFKLEQKIAQLEVVIEELKRTNQENEE
jgi:hypothetical protein